jgi:hypothetical protein
MTDPIDQNYSEKASYSAFLGLLTILSRTMLLLVRECEKACAIEGQEVWEVREVALVGCSGVEETAETRMQIDNYALYLKNCLLKEGYYFSY